MKKSLSAKAHLEYVREIKGLLPNEAFSPDPTKLLYMLWYFTILLTTYFLFRLTHNLFMYCILSSVIAHSLSCLGFLAHELSHHAIVKNKKYSYALEVISWAVNLIPATLWDRVHNHTHHTQINTPKDPDRPYFTSEKNFATYLYTKLFYPNKNSLKWNPLVTFHFIPYIFRNILSAFYPKASKPALVPFKPKYSSKQQFRIIMELVVVILFQIMVFFIIGKSWLAFLFASPVSYLLTSAVLNAYIFTNHFLNPVTDHQDPVMGTTTVKVPAIVNKIHFNFSYHTEHHLFPSMNSKFYPALSKILREKYPDRYNYLLITDAWKKLWNNDDFISVANNNTRVSDEER